MASKYYFYCEQTNAHSSDVTCICVSKTGLVVTGSGDKTLKYWNFPHHNGDNNERALNLIKTLTDHQYSVNSVCLSPGGSLLCSASTDGSSRIWDARTGSELASLVQPSSAAVRTAAFCPGPGASVLASAGDDEAVCLWDLSTGNLVRTIRNLEATVFSIAFSPDGEILVTSDAFGRVKVWSALIGHNQMLTSAEEAHDLGVNSICFSPIFSKGVLTTDYHLVTCGIDGFVCRWNIQTGNIKEIKLVTRRRAHDGSAMAVSISPDGDTIVTGGGDKVIKIWSQFLEPCQTLEGHSRYVTSLAFSPCGQILVSGSNDQSLRVWARSDMEHISFQNIASSSESLAEKRFQVLLSKSQNRQLGTLSGHSLDVSSLDSRDSMIVSGCADSLVRVWQWSESEQKYAELTLSPLVGHTYAVYSVTLDAGGKRLVSAGLDGRVILWSLSSGDTIQSWTHPERLAFRVVALSPDGAEIAAGCDDNKVYRWSLGQGEGTERILQWHDNTVQALAFSAASNLLASGCSGGALSIWSADSGPPLMTEVDGHDLGVTGMQFKLDGSLVTVGNDGVIRIWSVHLGGELQCDVMVKAHHTSILSVRISSDQEILVTGSGDKTCKVWCMSSLACVSTLGPHETYVTGAASNRLTGALAVGVGRSIVLYRLPPIGAETSARGHHDISNWSTAEVAHWLGTLGLSGICEKLSDVNGAQLRRLSLEELISFGIDEDTGRQICDEILMCDWSGEIPDEFVCPITCDIMTSPVRCSDGFVYEECAIKEWLMTRRNTSPMTNLEIDNTDFQPCKELKSRIEAFKLSSC